MAAEQQDTWRSKLTGTAERRGIPLATIVVTVAVVIAMVDVNAALILGIWVLRTIVLYLIVAFFITLLLTPGTRFLKNRGMSHGGSTLTVFLLGALILIGLVYLFASPLVTAVSNFAHDLPTLIRQAKRGHGWLGHLVYRLHLQKYLSESSSKLTSQITKVLKPATAFSVGEAAFSTLVAIVTIAVMTFFTMLEAPRMWSGFLRLFKPTTSARLSRVVDETIRSITGYMGGNFLTSIIAGVVSGVTLAILGVPFALLLGVFVALVDLLPLVGGLIAGLPVVIIAVIHSLTAGIVMLIVFLAYQQIENHILNPIVMSKTVRLNPFWVLLAVLVGATLGGRVAGGLGSFVGALVGIPFGGAIQVIIRELRKGPDAEVSPEELMGTGPPSIGEPSDI